MNKISFRTLKVFCLSIISFLLYFFIDNSNRINSILISIQKSNSSKGFGVFISINLLKWFLLIFGVVSLFLVGQKVYKKK